ncbi:TPA: hypothetical protein U1348_001815, partial [Streptococcus suis]|nr:hypothetical protein [Streptococcus suis]HEM5246553.1 hypothetical protein [Streptococcus suis]
MTFNKQQIANFLSDKIVFRVHISNEYSIEFNSNSEFSFDDIEKLVKSNLSYWTQTSKKASNPFQSNWNELNNKLVNIRKYFSELEELDVENINSYLYSYLSSNRQNDSQGRMIYILYVDSPIDKDLEIRK